MSDARIVTITLNPAIDMTIGLERLERGRVNIGRSVTQQAGDFIRRKAEPTMRLLLAQLFDRVRREINDDDSPSRAQRRSGFANGARGIVEKMQHLMDDDEIERVAFNRQRINVALTQFDAAQACFGEVGARHLQHRGACINADKPLRAAREQLKHAACASAEIEQGANRFVAGRSEDRLLNVGFSDMQRADAIPFDGVA